jgi:hypothetical protein
VFIPLHKGADIFLSTEQFATFYWPSLKSTLLALITAGCMPILFLEGPYYRHLDIMAADPLPKGKSIWIFSQIDMKAAKAKIGSWACIGGNVPASLFKQGSPEMLEEYCCELIESCGRDGGFFLFPGTILDQANPDNIRTYVNCGQKFGRFKASIYRPVYPSPPPRQSRASLFLHLLRCQLLPVIAAIVFIISADSPRCHHPSHSKTLMVLPESS